MFSRGIILLPIKKSPNLSRIVVNTALCYSTKSTGSTKTSSVLLKGATLGASVGIVYSVYSHYDINQKKKNDKTHNQVKHNFLKNLPDVKITKKIKNLGKESDLDLILFQYQSCPFCSKVRAFLNANGIAYSVVEVDSLSRKAVKWSDTKKVPMLLAKTSDGYVQLTDSSAIISMISTYMLDRNQNFGDIINFYPIYSYVDNEGKKKEEILNKYFLMFKESTNFTKDQIENERKWRKWTDDVLIHTICPNIYRTVAESNKTLQFFAEVGDWKNNFGGFQSWLMVNGGTYTMWMLGKLLKKKYQLEDDVRVPLYEACTKWSKEVHKTNGPFMGGNSPDLSDLAVYGLLNCIEGSEAFKDVIENTNIKPWFYSVKNHIANNTRNIV